MRIERYAPTWHNQVVALAGRVFGAAYFDRPWEAANATGSVMFVATEGDKELIGFVQGRVLPQRGLNDYLEGRQLDIPPDIADADAAGALGVIHAIAVAPEHRGKGVGSTLLMAVHDSLVGEGADKLIATFKRGPSAARVEGIMGKLGFEFWTSLPSYWKPQCDSGEFRCVDREDECICTAMFYRKPVY